MRGVYRLQNTGIIRSHVMKIYPAAVRHRGEAASDWRIGFGSVFSLADKSCGCIPCSLIVS